MLFSAILPSRSRPHASPLAAFPTYFAPRNGSPLVRERAAKAPAAKPLQREDMDLDQLVRAIGEW